MRWAPLGLVLAGCLHGKSHQCPSENGETWVCPEDKGCADPPVYCGTASEVDACDGKMDRDPCSTTLVPDGQCLDKQCTACTNDIAGCRYVGWIGMTQSASTSALASIAFTDFGEAYAGTADGTMLRYQIEGWTVDDRFSASAGGQISNLTRAGTRVYAFNTSSQVYALDGDTWTNLTIPPLVQTYNAMWATGNDVFLVGSAGHIAHLDGTWTETAPFPTVTLKAVWGTSATDVYAAGTMGATSALLHYNGTTWSQVTGVPNIGPLSTVWASGTDVFAAAALDGSTMILHGVNGSFTAHVSPPIAVNQIWGSTPTDVFAVGTGGAIVHWDGTSWVAMDAPSIDLAAISGSSGSEVFAVGTGGTVERYTGLGWAALAMQPNVSALTSIWAAAPNDAVAVGAPSDPSIFHYRDEALSNEKSSPTLHTGLTAVWGRSPSDAYATGRTAATHFTTTWDTQTATSITSTTSMWGDASSVYAVGDQVYKFDGTSWSVAVAGEFAFEGVWLAPSGKIWIAADNGIFHVDGTTAPSDVSGAHFNAIWGSGETDVFAAGVGEIRHFDGTSWTAMTTLPTGTPTLTGLWGASSNDVFAVGAASTVLHYRDGVWKGIKPTFSADLTSVSGSGDAIYMTGGGHVYRLLETTP